MQHPVEMNEQPVKQALDEMANAIRQNDVDALAKMWADDCVFVISSGHVISRDQRLDSIRSGLARLNPTGRDQETIRVYGDMAISVSRFSVTGQIAGQDASNQLRVTSVLVKNAERWQLVTQQVTTIPAH